jgi:hypothetical protein
MNIYLQEARRYFAVERIPFSLEQGKGEEGESKRACSDVYILEMRPLV